MTIDGKAVRVRREPALTLALNKPRGVLCSNADPHHDRTVFDLLPKAYAGRRLYCAGRLDKDSEGLLILTDDGDLANRLTHPSSRVVKRYRVDLTRPFDPKHARVLTGGLRVEGERLQADKVVPLTRGRAPVTRLEVHLHQGRKREIRRMLETLGYRVARLERFQIGRLVLRGIGTGQSRPLCEQEIRLLFG